MRKRTRHLFSFCIWEHRTDSKAIYSLICLTSCLWLSLVFQMRILIVGLTGVRCEARATARDGSHCAVWWSARPSPGTTSTLWRGISTTDSSATTMITSLTSRYITTETWSLEEESYDLDCLWCRRVRPTPVTTALLSWEKWWRTLGMSSPRLGSLFLPGISLR